MPRLPFARLGPLPAAVAAGAGLRLAQEKQRASLATNTSLRAHKPTDHHGPGAPTPRDPGVFACGRGGFAGWLATRPEPPATLVAADFSPGRRELALKMGADVTVDPGELSPYESWKEVAVDRSGAAPAWAGSGRVRIGSE